MSNFTWPAILSFLVFALNMTSQQAFIGEALKPYFVYASALVGGFGAIFFGLKTEGGKIISAAIRKII